MKYLIALVLSAVSVAAQAQHGYHRQYHHHHHHRHNGYNWVAPMIIGGVVTYALTRPQQPPPVVYQQPLPPAPYGYRYEQILDANCNCYRWVLVQG
jgi:hypothetical protein